MSVFGYDCAVLSSPIKYIGKSYSVEEYEKLDICELEVCKKDAEKFLSLASHENNSDACASLEEFSCGNFIKFGATKYTSNFNGVEMDVDAEFSDYLKIVLEEEIREDEPKIVKLVKKYHQNCVSPGKFCS